MKFVMLKLFPNVVIVLEQIPILKTEITVFKFMIIGWGWWIELAEFMLSLMFFAKKFSLLAEKEGDGQGNPQIYGGLLQAQ